MDAWQYNSENVYIQKQLWIQISRINWCQNNRKMTFDGNNNWKTNKNTLVWQEDAKSIST